METRPPGIPAPEPALRSQPCVAVSSVQVLPVRSNEGYTRGTPDEGCYQLNENKYVRLVRRAGLEPATHGLKGRCSTN